MSVDARDRLIVALDAPLRAPSADVPIGRDDALAIVEALDEAGVRFVKVGWALYLAAGQPIVRELAAAGKKVFLDLKFGDIAETVRRLVLVATADGVELLTLNGTSQLCRAAAAGRGEATRPLLLQVTLLTSLGAEDLAELTGGASVEDYVLARARRAVEAGADGVICSGQEARALREALGPEAVLVTPGIRPAGTSRDEQKRAVTPAEAVAAGSDYLVVGRPILRADDPADAARRILDEMQTAFDRRGA